MTAARLIPTQPDAVSAEPLPSPLGFWRTLTPAQQHEFAKDYGATLPAPPVVFTAPLQREEPVQKPQRGHEGLRSRKELLRTLDRYSWNLGRTAAAMEIAKCTLRDTLKRLAPDEWERCKREGRFAKAREDR